jgi:hypothetical protein
MKLLRFSTFAVIATLGALMLAGAMPASAQAPTPQERVAALKGSLAMSQELLKQNRCYYGADGKLQKVVVVAPPPEEKKRGLRGAIVAHKKEEMTEYMQSAVGLVKSYIPPEPARIEQVVKAGKMSITPAGPQARLDFHDYEKPGDILSVEIDVANNNLLGLKVVTWLKDSKDAVTLTSRFGRLNDGATYPAENTLSAPSQSLNVKVTNSGYRKQ